jgi:hypothetical protein
MSEQRLDYHTGLPPGEHGPGTGSPTSSAGSGYVALGWLLLVGGIVATAYFIVGFDTSVAAPGLDTSGLVPGTEPDRVNNVGLLVDKICAVIGTSALSVAGAALIVAGQVQAFIARWR